MGQDGIPVIDLSGQRFGALTAVSYVKSRKWLCRCDCGTEKVYWQINLRKGRTQSCGCIQAVLRVASKTRHGHARAGAMSKTYKVWKAMKRRCLVETAVNFARYGGRGIKICDRWMTFDNFLADMGECPSERSIDRINNDGNYEPGNCRWATASEQERNKRPKQK